MYEYVLLHETGELQIYQIIYRGQKGQPEHCVQTMT